MTRHFHMTGHVGNRIRAWYTLLVAAVLAAGACCAGDGSRLSFDDEVSGTFSIVAVDPEAGVCGAAVASKYPAVGKVVPYVRAGIGAFCTQHWHNPEWGEKALDMLAEGKLPEEVLAELLRDDERKDKRQLAVIDMSGRAANRNPANADESGIWWGAASGRFYACQGNTLTGSEVVFAMAEAYEETEGSLADRLMAALLAGDCAGGDHRGRLAAGIRVAKEGIEGHWLELDVNRSDDAVIDLARKYAVLEHEAKGEWSGARAPFEHPCPERRGETSSADGNIHLRGRFENARIRFEKEKKGHVAFIGGSITEMNGYRPMVMEILEQRFPQTEFTFTDAGISSTCSTTGAFRLADHVLSEGPVDLFFVEFAVNDDQDAFHARRDCIRGMEGIVRRTRLHNPNADIVITYFVNPGMLETWQSGEVPLSVGAHREVAEYYQVSTINLAKEVADRITAGRLTWEQFGGTHPKTHGNQICASMIDRLMSRGWTHRLGSDAKAEAHRLPEEPLDEKSYFRGRLIGPDEAKIVRGMSVIVPEWSKIRGGFRKRFAGRRLLCGSEPGAEMTLRFEGTAVGAYVLAGPDAGIVETSIDGGPYEPCNLYHDYSKGLHYPRTVIFDGDLEPGEHELRLRISAEKDERSTGHSVRVLHFVAN